MIHLLPAIPSYSYEHRALLYLHPLFRVYHTPFLILLAAGLSFERSTLYAFTSPLTASWWWKGHLVAGW